MKIFNVFLASDSRFIFSNKTNTSLLLKNTIDEISNGVVNRDWNLKIKIVPWWDEPSFKKAGTTMDTLSHIAKTYDAGIFVLGKDLQGHDAKFQPNSNVTLEYGMFKAAGKIAFLVKESDDVKPPTDMDGQNSTSLERPNEVVSGFLQTLKNYRNPERNTDYRNICIYYNSILSNKLTSLNDNSINQFREWETKALYVGSKSAGIWESVENSKEYNEYIIVRKFIDRNRQFLKTLPIENVISFGPGAGKVDIELMKCMPDTYYIPIDLNVSLAIRSAKSVASIKGCHVPFAVIDDFEESGFYANFETLIETRKNETGKLNLFSLLGVTFSNLSMTCSEFFENIQWLMKDSEDFLLLDAIIYENEDDEQLTKKVKLQLKKYEDLLRNSIRKKKLPNLPKTKLNKKVSLNDFLEFEIVNNKSDEYANHVSIPETKLVFVKYKGNILLIAKFYRFDKLEDYISNRFEICRKETIQNRGIFLLKKSVNIVS